MAYEMKYYADPAMHVKFERETIPCYGCMYLIQVFEKYCCDKGNKVTKRCEQFKGENQ